LRSLSGDETPIAPGNTKAVLAATEELVKELADARATIARLETSLRGAHQDLERAAAKTERNPDRARDPEPLDRLPSPRPTAGQPMENGERSTDLIAGTETERASLRSILRDLNQGSIGFRLAALERLALMPTRLAAPVYAAALSLEVEPKILAHLCRVAGRCGVHSLIPLLGRHVGHPDEEVRMAVVFAMQRLARAEGSNAPPVREIARQEDAARGAPAVLQRDTVFTPEDLATSRRGRLREIERELRQSLRGLTHDALVETLELSHEELHSALDAAMSAGRVVRRGPRYFAS
jgi:hypothetical protein